MAYILCPLEVAGISDMKRVALQPLGEEGSLSETLLVQRGIQVALDGPILVGSSFAMPDNVDFYEYRHDDVDGDRGAW